MENINNTEEQNMETTRHEGWEDNYSTLLMRLDPSPTIETIKHMLLNEQYNGKTESWEQIKELKPRMKKAGVEKLMLELRSRMSIDKVLSNLREQKINLIVRQVGEVILQFLWFNADEFDIDESEFESITWIIVHNVDIFLRRALLGVENKLLNKSMDYKETTNRRSNEQSNFSDQSNNQNSFNPMRRFGGRK